MQEQQFENTPLSFENIDARRLPESPSPDNPPWNTGIAIFNWVMSVVFIAIIPIFGTFVYLAAAGNGISSVGELGNLVKNDPNIILVNIISIIPAHILTVLLGWVIVTRFNKYSFAKMIGWELGGFNPAILAIIVFICFAIAVVIAYFIPEQENDLLRMLKSSQTVVYFVAFMATFTAPLVEELVYRGILYSAFQRSIGVPLAIALVTLLFAIIHVPQYYPSYGVIIVICILSLILTLVRMKSKNLLPCIILHTAFNGIQSLGLIFSPYLDSVGKTDAHPAFFMFFK